MNIFKTETDNSLILAKDINVPGSSKVNTILAHVVKKRHLSLEELQQMSMQELVAQLRAGKRAVLYTQPHRIVQMLPQGVQDYLIDSIQAADIDALRKEIRLQCTTKTVLSGEHTTRQTRVKDSYQLDMPYPLFAHYTLQSGSTIVAFKVPQHKEYFNAPSYGVERYQYTCPALIFILTLTPNFNITQYAVRMLQYDVPLLTGNVRTYHLPMPNIFNNDGICIGSSYLEGQQDCVSIGQACSKFVLQILSSNWRNDLQPTQFPQNFRDLVYDNKDKFTIPASCTNSDLAAMLALFREHGQYYSKLKWSGAMTVKDFVSRTLTHFGVAV